MGNIEIAEKAAIANHDIAALLFLYTITGNQAKLTKLSHKLSSSSSDPMARFNLALIRGDAEERASILSELGLDHLAAKTRETWSSSALVLRPSLSRHIANWPLTRTMEAMFEDQWAGLEAAAKAAAAKLPPAASAEDDVFEDVQAAPAAPVVDTKAWDDDELDAQLEHVQLPVTVSVGSDSGTKPAPLDVVAYGDSRESRWLARRKMPVDLVTCGEFVEALSVLQRRIALVNPAPLKPLFEDIVMASHACVPGLPFTPSISVPISNPEGDGPGILFTVGFLKTKLTEVLHHTGFGNASEALAAARYVIHALTVTLAKSSEEEAELLEILATAQKYAHAMLIETTRRESTSDKVREMELAAYLCCEKLEPIHTLLVTDLAMKMAFKSKCYIQASLFAKRIITGSWGSSDEFVTASTTRARKVIIASEERGTDEFKTNFDAAWMTAGEGFKLCSGTLTPVPPQLHDKMVACPLCKSSFHPDYQGQACTVCQLSQVGATALGLQFLPL
jgi:coatomer protein complex subunit alpha (xenin)